MENAAIDESLQKSLNLISELICHHLVVANVIVFFRDVKQQTIFCHKPTLKFDIDRLYTNICEHKDDELAANKQLSTSPYTEDKYYTSSAITSLLGEKLGILVLLHNEEISFSEEEAQSMKHFAQLFSNIMENYQQSKKMQRVFTDFMHKAIHDLKNPLTSISLTSELLTRKANDVDTVINLSERLQKANDRVFYQLEQLKVAFPANDSSYKLNIKEIEVNNLLFDVAKSTNSLTIVRNGEEISLHGDYQRLKEALIHIIYHILLQSKEKIELKHSVLAKQVAIELYGGSNKNYNSTDFIIASTLITMHKGKIENTNNIYYIYLPLDTP